MSDCALEAAQAFSRGDLAGAVRLAQTALAQDPGNKDAGFVLIAVSNRTGRFEEALALLEEALTADPDSPELWRLKVDTLQKIGRKEESLQGAERLCKLTPDSPDARFARALCYLSLARPEPAEQDLVFALSRKPAGTILHHLGIAVAMLGRYGEAVQCFQKAMALEPRIPNHATALGRALLEDERPVEAVAATHRALELRPNDYHSLLLLGQSLSETGRVADAEVVHRKALGLRPDSTEAHTQFGMWLHEMGRFQEADQVLARAQELDPCQTMPLSIKLSGKKVTEADRRLVGEMQRRLEAAGLATEDRISLHFGLGKALNDLGDLPLAFQHYDEAHRLLLSTQGQGYDPQQEEATLAKQVEVFSPESLASLSQGSEASDRPIFVVGLIRSGTTLMEQLLSAHPEVSGVGERSYWMRNAYNALDATKQRVDPDNARRVATVYLRLLEQFAPVGRRVVDKMPTNHWMAGFINACLPNSRIVHMLRDPVDVALSIWMTYMGKPPAYTSDRKAIVHAIRLHDSLQRHWESVLPPHRYLAVRYEELTRDPEPVMRKVLAFCDLEWDEACIHPERNERFVSTPSLYRVRKPIDSSSVGKKERYGPYLGEFAELASSEGTRQSYGQG